MTRFRTVLTLMLCLLGCLPATGADFAIVNARIFEGMAVIPKGTVVVRDGRIAAVGPDVQPPAGMEVINGAGATLLPGFIDSHTHVFGEEPLRRALAFGVTTELDMFSAPPLVASLREEQAKTGAPQRADVRSAGILATAPGGHGTQFGLAVPTLTKPEEAQAWVDARIAEGSDYIKIVSEDGAAYKLELPGLDGATIAAVIKAAHERGKLAVVHVSTQDRARAAIEAGADGLVHIFSDRAPEPGFARVVAAKGAFVVPTLTVVESTTGVAGGRSLPEDPRLAAWLTSDEVTNLSRSFPARAGAPNRMEHALEAVRQLKAAGVPLLAGSDAPNPGTAHGASIHRELELLVKAGLSPTEALAAATSAPAKAFKLDDRGWIAPGLRADLILVKGDPSRDITATRDILRLWKGGVPVQRTRTEPAPAAPKGTRAEIPKEGLVSDFEDGGLATRFGSGWTESTDKLAGGQSTVRREVVSGGAQGERSLEISGETRKGFSFPWAGMMFSPGGRPMVPADLSAAKEVSFWAQGDGGTYQIMVFATRLGMMPSQKSFVAGPEWKLYTFPLADFGLDGSDITGIFWGAGPDLREFRFRIDEVRLVPR
ncbi:MAG TPA: amidohydrolase family protein [Thermoanaerobaculia bacterium]|nr:amidohydrolase family protein [Thermoanaerobaculia bacterium]